MQFYPSIQDRGKGTRVWIFPKQPLYPDLDFIKSSSYYQGFLLENIEYLFIYGIYICSNLFEISRP